MAEDHLLDGAKLRLVLEELGKELGRRRVRGEINLYGGSAIILQFDFRGSTKDADARIVQGHGAVVDAQREVARKFGLPDGWLNEQVVPYLSSARDSEGVGFFGSYPDYGTGWLVVRVAKPEYLLAMKVVANRGGSPDLNDATELAVAAGLITEEAIRGTVSKYFPNMRPDLKTEAAIQEVSREATLLVASRTGDGEMSP